MRTIERINYEITQYNSSLTFADKVDDYIGTFGGFNIMIAFILAIGMSSENVSKHTFIVMLIGFIVTSLLAFISGLTYVAVERKCKFYFNKIRLLEVEKQTIIYNELKKQEEIHYNEYSEHMINVCNFGHDIFNKRNNK